MIIPSHFVISHYFDDFDLDLFHKNWKYHFDFYLFLYSSLAKLMRRKMKLVVFS